MTLVEFAVVLVVAIYAMIGGAFINAAITSPIRCLRVLSWMWSEVISTYLISGLGFIAVGLAMRFALDSSAAAGIGIMAMGAAHLALFVLFLAARRVATAALDPEEEEAAILAPQSRPLE